MRTILKFLITALISNVSYSSEEKEEFRNEVQREYISGLCRSEFLACIGMDRQACVTSVTEGAKSCSFDEYYMAASTQDVQGFTEHGRNFGFCVSNYMLSKTNVSEEEASKCVSQININGRTK